MKIEEELIQTGRIVQDGDAMISQKEAECRFNRYIELVNGIRGTESPELLRALFKSIQVEDNYGAYQCTMSALTRFSPDDFGKICIEELPRLIHEFPDWAGDILVGMSDRQTEAVNCQLTANSGEHVKCIVNFVREQEQDNGWLSESRDFIAPGMK